jgi:hypothetical protein
MKDEGIIVLLILNDPSSGEIISHFIPDSIECRVYELVVV